MRSSKPQTSMDIAGSGWRGRDRRGLIRTPSVRRSPTPRHQDCIHLIRDDTSGDVARGASHEQLIVTGRAMTDVGHDCEAYRPLVQCLGVCRASDPTTMLETRMVGDLICCRLGTPWELGTHRCRKLLEVLVLELLLSFPRSCPSPLTDLGVGDTLRLRLLDGGLFDQEALALVPLARTTPSDNHRAQPGVLAGSSGQRGIPRREEHQVVEVGAAEAEGLLFPLSA